MVFQRFKKLVLVLENFQDAADIQRVINSLQNAISDSINPILSKVQNDSQILTGQQLMVGQKNIINTQLNRNLIGWRVIGQTNQADIWDNQINNPSPNLTLWLYSSADVTVNLEVF